MISEENRAKTINGRFRKTDEKIFLFCYNRLRNPVFDVVMPVLSNAGNSGRLWIIGSVLVLFIGIIWLEKPLLEPVLAMLSGIGLAELAAEGVIKNIWWKDRPYKTIEGVSLRVPARFFSRTSSFPSGHSSAYIGSAVLLAAYFPNLAPLFLAIGFLGAFSRIYVGAHYPSDVAAGALIGLCCALPVIAIFHRYLWPLVVIFFDFLHLKPFLIH